MELIVIYLFVLAVGLCVGSFLNVVVLRAFSNESIAYPASKCPVCQTPLKWWHNIPVLSYILLGGKCGFCKDKISVQYPVVEMITGVLFCAIFWKYQWGIQTLFMMGFASLFVVIAVTDFREKVVFDVHTISLIVLGLIYNFFDFSNLGSEVFAIGAVKFTLASSFINAFWGMIVGALVMEILARSGYLFAKTRAFGEGDSYIAAGLGAIFGVQSLLLILVGGIVIQLCYIIPLFLRKLYLAEDYRTLFSLVGFLIIAVVVRVTNGFEQNLFLYIPFIVLFAGLGIYVCRRILAGMGNQDGVTYLPFGPALVIAGTLIMLI